MMRLLLLPCAVLVYGLAAVLAEPRYASVPIAPEGLMPRFFLDTAQPMEKRAAGCEAGSHSCLDIGHDEKCCANDSYCYVNGEGLPRCCPVGSNCAGDSECSSTAYFCNHTATVSGTATTQQGCCKRSCPQTSHYLCAAALGGDCCPYGAECRSGGACVLPATSSESSEPRLTRVADGCTTSQYKCPDGHGCCANWQHCTDVTGRGYCAAGNPTDSTLSVVEAPAEGLSDGAKAGIAVGAVVGAGLVLGAAVWLCISKRRRRRRGDFGAESAGLGGRIVGVSAAGSEAPGRDGTMTEVSAAAASYSRAPSTQPGMTQDYFGPAAAPGPYTETALSMSTAPSPGPGRAVPSQPHAPGDIAAAVEMDSGPFSPLSSPSIYNTPNEGAEGRHELYGSDLPPQRSPSLPTPVSPRSEQRHPHAGL